MPEDLAARREATKRISFRFPQTLAAMKDRQKLEQYRGQLKGTAPEQAKITEYLSNTVSVDLEVTNSPRREGEKHWEQGCWCPVPLPEFAHG